MDLRGKVIAITGGAQGLGLSMAEGLVHKGAQFALLDVNAERLQEAVTRLQKMGALARSYVTNVAD